MDHEHLHCSVDVPNLLLRGPKVCITAKKLFVSMLQLWPFEIRTNKASPFGVDTVTRLSQIEGRAPIAFLKMPGKAHDSGCPMTGG